MNETRDGNPNPYAPPTMASRRVVISLPTAPNRWLRRLLVLQIAVIVCALGVETVQHETIVGSGPVFSLVGLAIAIVALRRRDFLAVGFGTSAIIFSGLVVFLINFNGWGPAQGDQPITMMAWIYALIAIPLGCALVTRHQSAPAGWSELAN